MDLLLADRGIVRAPDPAHRPVGREAQLLVLAQGRRYRVVYNSSSLAGQIAVVESGLTVAVLTQCSAPSHLEILGSDHGLVPLEPMEVSVYRSQASQGNEAVDSLHGLLVKTFRISASF